MFKKFLSITVASALFLPTAALAQSYETTDSAPGYTAIMMADYATAEREIRGAPIAENDPARNINLGVVLAKTGHRDLAARHFEQVLREENVTLQVFDGRSIASHDLAKYALASLENGVLSR